MNPRNDGRNVERRSSASRGWLWLAVGGLVLSATIVGVVVVGGILRQKHAAAMAAAVPDQSEPDLESEPIVANHHPRPPAMLKGNIEQAAHEEDAFDMDEMDVETVPQSGRPVNGRGRRAPRVPFYSSTDLDELQIAEAAAAHGQWADAAKAYAEITMNPPVPIDVWYHRAIACLKCGNRATYREVCESMLDRVEMNPLNVPPINLVAWMCALGPDAIADPRRIVVLAEFLLAHLPDEPTIRHAYLNTVGGVFLRAGRHEEAVKRLNEGIAANDDGGTKQDWLLLALAYQQLGRRAEARQSLARMPANSPLNRRDSIWDRAEIELLQKEVEQAMSKR